MTPPPMPPPTSTDEALQTRGFVLTRRFLSANLRALVVGVLLGALFSAIVAFALASAPWPIRAAVVAVTLTGGALIGWTLAVPARIRMAWETFSWIGRWDVDRFERITGSRVPTSYDAMQRWLLAYDGRGADRFARAEILGSLGRIDEARTLLAETPPTDDPFARFEHRLQTDWVEWLATGEFDPTAVRAAAEALPRGMPERRRAEVMIAVNEARALADRGDDGWTVPLERLHPHVAAEARAIFRKDTLIPLGRTILVVGLAGAILLELVGGGSFGGS